ncbi:hypothetical protein ACFYWX_43400 [Streptomyces sp. NPDC002888]|uniref:hypothetical protein n=1 Tax=Streptomyces sp. NPDC002888 TaxID=3364668 RepID=UPI003692803E
MSAPETLPALTAGVSTGLVLLLRWAATRNAPASRSSHEREPASAPDDPVLLQAEEHVRRYWAHVRPLYPTPRD